MDSIGRGGILLGALAAALLLAVAARAQDEDALELACDRTGPQLAITSGDAPTAVPSGSEVTRVVWLRLIRYGREKNPAGDPLRTGSDTATHRCGDLAVSVQGGFLNANAVGELGALEFPVVAVRRGEAVIVPPTALAECEQGNPRYGIHGDCPGGYAESIRVRPSGSGWAVDYERAWLDPELVQRTQREEEVVPAVPVPTPTLSR